MSNKGVVTACLISLALFGCVSAKMPEVTRLPLASPRDILDMIAIPGSEDTIRATARISLSSPDGDYSRKVALLMRMPSSLRVETMPFFGPADFFLSANEESLKVFFPGEGKFYVGASTRENLSLFFKVFLLPADMVPLLAGVPPRVTGHHSGHVEGKLYRIDIESGERGRSLWIDPDSHTLVKIEDCKDGGTLWSAEFEDHIMVNGIPYPQKVHIEVQEPERTKMEVRYLDVDISSTGDGALFNLQIPSGVTPIPLDR